MIPKMLIEHLILIDYALLLIYSVILYIAAWELAKDYNMRIDLEDMIQDFEIIGREIDC